MAHLTGQQKPMQDGPSAAPMLNVGVGARVGVGPLRNHFDMDCELLRSRVFIQEQIYGILQQKTQSFDDVAKIKCKEMAKRLEESLYKTANTKEDYLNVQTLERRMYALIKQSQSQRPANSSAVGTMIPTTGMSHNTNHMAASSVNPSTATSGGGNSIAATTVNTGNLMPTGVTHGTLSNGYQQSPVNFSMGSGGNISSRGMQRLTSHMIPTPGSHMIPTPGTHMIPTPGSQMIPTPGSQMIPTPGFNNNNDSNNHNNQSQMNLKPSNNVGGFSTVSQPQRQKQQVGGQNSRLLQNQGRQMGSGMRSGLQTKSHGFSNGSSEVIGNVVNGSVTSEHLQQAFDQHKQPLMHGDTYGMITGDSYGSGNFSGPVSSTGSMMNTQHMNSVGLQTPTKASSPMMRNQSSSDSMQQTVHAKPLHRDQSEKMNSHSSFPQSHHQQHFQLQSHQSNQLKQFVRPPSQQKVQMQQQHLLCNDARSQSQPSGPSSQVKREPKSDHHIEVLPSRASKQFQVPELQHDISSSMLQNSQQMQLLQPHQALAESQNDLSSQWYSQPHMQNVQEDHRQGISGHDEAQHKTLPSDVSGDQITDSGGIANPPNSNGALCRSASGSHDKKQFKNQQRWLLFLRHARKCGAPEGRCPERNCVTVQELWRHIEKCNVTRCPYPRCHHTKVLIHHHRYCQDPNCPVCVPVKKYLNTQSMRPQHNSKLSGPVSGSCKVNDKENLPTGALSKIPSVVHNSEDLQPSLKRMKIEQSSQSLDPDVVTKPQSTQEYPQPDISMMIEPEYMEVKIEVPVIEVKKEVVNGICGQRSGCETMKCEDPAASMNQENVKLEKENDPANQESITQPTENAAGTKSGKPKIKGVSLTELFTPEQIREHIIGLRQWVGQSKSKAEKNQAKEHSISENSCQLCAVEKLTFEPPPIYCTPCGARIRRNAMYYTFANGETRHYLCVPCYNEARGENIIVDGTATSKATLEKKKNDEETEEWWVQCDKCEAWQHQICALFNGRRNDGGQAEYTCPNCYIAEVERGERKPLPQSALLGAKDLPRTIMSDHIENRLFGRLKQEREDRARVQGKSCDEVPGAEALVVRVVSSVDKKLEVKQNFLEIFREENYPTEFQYKSKVVLLFQKIEGVEVCLFGMYVQEFGTECAHPNQRRVYLSYLDSIKYFRPEIKAVTGEALRTFVYHEILIGYLEYCKKRGFTSCYIWACPPLKGEDYILYCHPEIQRTPKSDKLREWYLVMLRKARKENIVVDLINLYDHFFVTSGECKAKVTAARLPYFDGDYWPGAAEDLIYQINQDEDNMKQNKKGAIKKTISKRALKASGQSGLSGNASKDLLLMHRLGETISPMKEDFIMVHLQHCCSHCCNLMVSGNRWVCNQCKNFQICDKCYDLELNREERDRHPVYHRQKHALSPIEISGVPVDSTDKDEILESEFFDTRQAFLSLCQGNHYQYDTLRRAKHSSMMVLYHLHNPTAPAFASTCSMCHLDVEAGQGWRCEVCPDYDVCNACYQKDGGIDHPHKLTNHPSMADHDAQNKEARQQRVLQLRKMLDLLRHASHCRAMNCPYLNCRKVKGLFRHGIHCKIRATGGCNLCKKMWYLLQLHARACKELTCNVPRCNDLKEHLRRMQQQTDSRRRAAVMEMMRQRAAEVAGNSG